MLTYSYRLGEICSLSKSNSVYSKFFSGDILNNINDIYIPGGEPNDSILKTSAKQINKFVMNNNYDKNIYMCSCFYWYIIGECGVPMETYKCENCGELIGGRNHKLVERPGHVRIYINKYHKQNDRYRTIYQNPYKYLNEINACAERESKIQIKGFKKVKKAFFLDKDKKVRNISKVTYRILSFVFYSCIYYKLRMGLISSDELSNFYYSDAKNEDQSIGSILKDIWQILIEELKERNINDIKNFFDLLIPNISNIITNNESPLETPVERDNFEKLFEDIIEDTILDLNSNERNKFGQHVCSICFERVVRKVLVPCGHFGYCNECIAQLKGNYNSKCPLCKKKFTDSITLYVV